MDIQYNASSQRTINQKTNLASSIYSLKIFLLVVNVLYIFSNWVDSKCHLKYDYYILAFYGCNFKCD